MTILDKILEYKKTEVEEQKKLCGIQELKSKTKDLPETKSFLNILKKNKAENKISLIAEVKKASPSKGVIKADFNPVEIAHAYERSGASAVSVLTDEKFFQGSIQYLKDVKKIINLPVLRKDFIVDEYQIYQTRETGADIILLIASALEKEQFTDFYALSEELGLDILAEVNNKDELDFVLESGAKIIGINNRNLKTFEVDINNTINLIKDLHRNDRYFIGESGIETNNDVKLLQAGGASGILVGESLMKSDNIEKAVTVLLE